MTLTLSERIALSDNLDAFLKNDIACQGIKINNEARHHLIHLIEMWGEPDDIHKNTYLIRFYVMGFAAGIQTA